MILYLGEYLPGSDALKLAFLCGLTLSGVLVVLYSLVSSRSVSSSSPIAAVAAILIAAPALAVSLQQMETNLAILLLFSGIRAYTSGASGVALFLLGLSACTRFELLIPWFLFAVLTVKRSGVRSFMSVGISLVPVLVMLGGNFYYSGSFLPHSIIAKERVYQVMPADFFDVLRNNIAGTSRYAFGIVPQLSLGVLGIALITECVGYFRKKSEDTAIPVSLVAGVSGYSIGLLYLVKHVLLFPWYLPIIFVPVLYWALSNGLQVRSLHKVAGAGIISWPFLEAAVFSVAAIWQPGEYPDLMRSARARQYLRVGDALNQSCPDCTVLAPEIGAIGYRFEGKIVDACGLISPEALKYHPIPVPEGRLSSADGAVPHGLVEELEPEVIVSLDRLMRDMANRAIVGKYHVLTLSPFLEDNLNYIPGGHIWGSRHLLILLHREKVTRQIYERLVGLLPELRPYAG